MTQQCDVCITKYYYDSKRNKAKFRVAHFGPNDDYRVEYVCGMHLAKSVPETRACLVSRL